LQVHGDQGSIVIDNDLLTFIHTTPQGSEAEEKSYGSASESINQLGNYDLTEQTGPTTGSQAGGLSPLAHRRQYENFLAALAGEEPLRVDLETNRRSIGVITGVYESARTGKPVAL
jgi:UDP-N-acetyl-2-amino-2-deoxyglucuronate dehydrogenase